jgi:hypothetical protein
MNLRTPNVNIENILVDLVTTISSDFSKFDISEQKAGGY